jgi:hypothetical protein
LPLPLPIGQNVSKLDTYGPLSKHPIIFTPTPKQHRGFWQVIQHHFSK